VWKVCPSPLALVYFTGAVNILAVALAFFIMRQWLGSAAAWWATAWLASGPWAIQYCRWIWSLDIVFPVALAAYFFLGRWLAGRKWALMGLIVSLALLVQIHAAGVVVAVAIAIYWLWSRPRVAMWPAVLGILIAAASFAPYLLARQLAAPGSGRTGYQLDYLWRVFAGAAMSVAGLGWSLEFKDGYPAFVHSLGWRHWAYLPILSIPLALLAGGVAMAVICLWRQRRAGLAARRGGLAMVAAVAVLIVLCFDLLGIRTSPAYLPVWYPLPFALMGWAVVRLAGRLGEGRRTWLAVALLVTMAVQLAFFAEQLNYMRVQGGVPGSVIERDYAGATADVAAAARQVNTAEVWLLYEGNSPIQAEPAAWLMRRAKWAGESPGRTLLRFAWGKGDAPPAVTVSTLPADLPPPPGTFQVRPWKGAQQAGGKISPSPTP
jgi:hypothetical protein